jgi:hypothetical protein
MRSLELARNVLKGKKMNFAATLLKSSKRSPAAAFSVLKSGFLN